MAYTLNPYVSLPYSEGTQFTPNNSMGVVNYASGYIVMDSTTPVAVTVPLGFTPRKIRVIDVTSAADWTAGLTYAEIELLDFMQTAVAGATLVTAVTASTGAIEKSFNTSSLITINDSEATAGENKSFTIAASALTASHKYVFEAIA